MTSEQGGWCFCAKWADFGLSDLGQGPTELGVYLMDQKQMGFFCSSVTPFRYSIGVKIDGTVYSVFSEAEGSGESMVMNEEIWKRIESVVKDPDDLLKLPASVRRCIDGWYHMLFEMLCQKVAKPGDWIQNCGNGGLIDDWKKFQEEDGTHPDETVFFDDQIPTKAWMEWLWEHYAFDPRGS